jgi:hypothetical protein
MTMSVAKALASTPRASTFASSLAARPNTCVRDGIPYLSGPHAASSATVAISDIPPINVNDFMMPVSSHDCVDATTAFL